MIVVAFLRIVRASHVSTGLSGSQSTAAQTGKPLVTYSYCFSLKKIMEANLPWDFEILEKMELRKFELRGVFRKALTRILMMPEDSLE